MILLDCACLADVANIANPLTVTKSPSLFCLASNTMIQFTSFYQSLSGAYDPYLAAVYPTHKVSMKPLEPIETSSLLALYSFRLH